MSKPFVAWDDLLIFFVILICVAVRVTSTYIPERTTNCRIWQTNIKLARLDKSKKTKSRTMTGTTSFTNARVVVLGGTGAQGHSVVKGIV
jgi:hypothetical protein